MSAAETWWRSDECVGAAHGYDDHTACTDGQCGCACHESGDSR